MKNKKMIIVIIVIIVIGIGCYLFNKYKSKSPNNNITNNTISPNSEPMNTTTENNDDKTIDTLIVTKSSWGDAGGKFATDTNEPIEYKIHKDDVIIIDTKKYTTWSEEEQKFVDKQKNLTVEIINIEEDSITIKTNQGLSDNNSVIDTKNIFNIEKNKKLKLNTPTLDAQESYEIEIK